MTEIASFEVLPRALYSGYQLGWKSLPSPPSLFNPQDEEGLSVCQNGTNPGFAAY